MSILPLMLVLMTLVIMTLAQDLRWTNKGKVRVKRQINGSDPDPDMADVATTLENLEYKGDIRMLEKQDEEWLPTSEGPMQQYAIPSKDTEQTLEEAVTTCRTLGGRLWDKDPQYASGFDEIELEKNYWILSEDGSMAQYTTTKTPESIFDETCTYAKVKADRRIEVATLNPIDEVTPGCIDNNIKGLTLCLRPVRTYTYANDPNYRKDQQETKILIGTQKERATEQLQNINEELTMNNFQSTSASTKSIETIKTIRTNINNIKEEDAKPFPNFRKIKTDWKDIMTQLQDLEGISTKLHHEKQIKQIKDELAVDRGHQATERQSWDTNWTNMMRKVEDNRKNIQLATRTESETEPEREPTTIEPGEDSEEDQMSTTSKNYFRWLKENFTLMTTNYDKFCNEWQLNCKAIAVTSVIMMGVGLATMITAIILAVKAYNLTKEVSGLTERMNRIYEYMDLKTTKEKQEEDDGKWTLIITQNQNNTHNNYTANPTRNKAQIKENYTKLTKRLNIAEEVLLDRGINIKENLYDNPYERQRDPNMLYRDRGQGATSPLLGQ